MKSWLDRELEYQIAIWRKRTSDEVIRVALRGAATRMQWGEKPPPARPDPNALFKLPKLRGSR